MDNAPFATDLAAIAGIGVIQNILTVVCQATGMGFSAVARVTEQHWVACAVRDDIHFGLEPGSELEIGSTFCNQIRQSGALVVIDEVATDEQFRDHPIPKQYGFQSYISVPIRLPDGRFFGTLCAIDPRPARINTEQTVEMFKLFADLIGLHLDAQDRLSASETALVAARERAQLQDQFVAVLGHDLRNPLSAIQTGATLLRSMGLEPRGANVAAVIGRSAARMSGLIDNVLDFARSRLGSGIRITLRQESGLHDLLDHVVDEIRTAHSDRVIRYEVDLSAPVVCDGSRVGQLLSNLLANALAHGDPVGPVDVLVRSDREQFRLSVANRGIPIDRESTKRLFQPFVRGADASNSRGLGLGLYIASEIARAHGGSIDVSSGPAETRFTFVMPVAAAVQAAETPAAAPMRAS